MGLWVVGVHVDGEGVTEMVRQSCAGREKEQGAIPGCLGVLVVLPAAQRGAGWGELRARKERRCASLPSWPPAVSCSSE